MGEGGGEEQTKGAHSGTHDVVIGYASHDAAVANDVAAALEGLGLKYCKRISLASIAQRWLEVERAMGIENAAPDPPIS